MLSEIIYLFVFHAADPVLAQPVSPLVSEIYLFVFHAAESDPVITQPVSPPVVVISSL